jgi:hypothetical protein
MQRTAGSAPAGDRRVGRCSLCDKKDRALLSHCRCGAADAARDAARARGCAAAGVGSGDSIGLSDRGGHGNRRGGLQERWVYGGGKGRGPGKYCSLCHGRPSAAQRRQVTTATAPSPLLPKPNPNNRIESHRSHSRSSGARDYAARAGRNGRALRWMDGWQPRWVDGWVAHRQASRDPLPPSTPARTPSLSPAHAARSTRRCHRRQRRTEWPIAARQMTCVRCRPRSRACSGASSRDAPGRCTGCLLA